MAWPGTEPLAFYRGLIDDVDVELGDLLNRRAALTRAVQQVKGSTERDLDREREIAAPWPPAPRRWARTAPPGSCTRSSPRAWTPPLPSSDVTRCRPAARHGATMGPSLGGRTRPNLGTVGACLSQSDRLPS